MSYIASQYEPPHSLGPGSSGRPPADNRSLADELSAIVSAFASDIRSQFLDVEVFSNQELRMRRDSFRRRQKFEPHLFRGIITLGDTSTAGSPNGRPIDALENHSDVEICGMNNPFENPEQAVENAKLFAISRGFSLEELKARLTGKPDKKQADWIAADVERFMREHGVGNIHQARATLLEDTGKRYEDLSPEEKSQVDDAVKKMFREIAASLGGRIDEIDGLLARFKEL